MTTEITIAATHLSATRTARGYVYRDAATGRRYRVTARAMAALGAMLAAQTPDAYSTWCSIHPAIALAR